MANLKDLIVSGPIRAISGVIGDLTGTADKAIKDASGNTITSTYATKTELNAVNKNTMRSTEFIVGTQASATGSWTGVTEDSSLYDGKNINYFLPQAGSGNATLNLTLSGGTTTGAKPVYLNGTSYVTTHYGANSCISMTYNSSKGAWFVNADRDANDFANKLQQNTNVKARGTCTINKIICGNSSGYQDVASGVTFDISYPLLVCKTAIATGNLSYNNFLAIATNLQSTKASWTGTQYSMAFLVGTLSGTTFTIDSSVFTTTVPTTQDNKVYMPIGQLYSTYECYFNSCRDLYAYRDGSFQKVSAKYVQGSATQPIYFDSNGQPQNTTYTLGKSVPSDAKFTDTVYTHPTTSGNKHIPSGGSSGQILKYSADGTATWANEYSYTHPTTSGNKHIPSGGSSGQFLKWSADGTATWAADNDTKNTAGSTDTSSKIFLVGATSQAANPQTYSHDTVFVDTDGALNSATPTAGNNSTKVATTAFVTTAIGSYLPKSGGTMTGAITFANGTWNSMGDDASIGDQNVGGHICIKPNNATYDNSGGIQFKNSSGTNLVQLNASSNTLTSSGALGVSNNAAKMQYNSTTEAIEFVFS